MTNHPDIPEDIIAAIMAEERKRIDALAAEHKKIIESPEYQEQLARLEKYTLDFLRGLKACWFSASRSEELIERSLFMRSVDDFYESAITIRFNLEQGSRNPARREIRYMIELAIKALYVDQKMPRSPLEHRLIFFDRQVNKSSITPEVNLISLFLLNEQNSKDAVSDLITIYARACEYVHPSIRQIRERLDLATRGITIGFETANELAETNDSLFEAYALVLVFAMHSIGASLTGDLFEGSLRHVDDWAYHGHKCLAEVDAYFDYKAERQAHLEQIREERAKRLHK